MTKTVRKREFMRYSAKYLGDRYDICDRHGQVVAKIYPATYHENIYDAKISEIVNLAEEVFSK